MASLIYIHGFLSSPQSHKALQVKTWLAQHYPQISYFCPQLTPYPEETRLQLESLVESLLPEPVYLIGSSLGGFWASWLVEKYNLSAILINPSVAPHLTMPKYIGMPVKSFYSDDVYWLNEQHMNAMAALSVLPNRKNNYWLMVQTGDEVLDYRQAVKHYQGVKQTIEEGGDHSFQGFERHLNKAIEFFIAFKQ